jgi:addiction module RelB/DinJ family antitoxin
MEKKTSEIRVLVEPSLKKESKAIFEKIGMTESEGIRIFLRNLVNRKGFPFELNIPTVNDQEQKELEDLLDKRTADDKKITSSDTHKIDL